jgi:ADP-ribosyl-[dinitrogen reductase] hydrolase
MLGAIIGDIVGSVYEFRNYRAKDFDPFFHPKAFFTDDTVCTVAVADALANSKDPAITLKEWCRQYWDNGGWGMRFAEWVSGDEIEAYGSFGNGAAMRVSSAGLLAKSIDDAIALSNLVTTVTHNHPEGLKGAAATAVGVFLARHGSTADEIRSAISSTFGYDLTMTVDQIRPTYRYNETCQNSVPQAIVCALEGTSFEDAIRNAISIGGDSDTIAAIAGGIAEARFGISDEMAGTAWSYLPLDMRAVITKLYAVAGNGKE